jgi:hypothetical protein
MTQQKPLTINDVHQHFQLWRTNKTSGKKIPESLWDLVKQLLENPAYKRCSIIGKTLGISTHQLKNKFPQKFKLKQNVNSLPTKIKKVFAPAPLPLPLSNLMLSSQNTLVIERSNGVKLSITTPNSEQFSTLIKIFME